MAYDVALDIKADMKQRNPGLADRSLSAEVRGKTVCELKFKVELKGSGTAGTAPRWGALMKACDRFESANAGSNVIYKPASTSETCTIWVNMDGILHKMVGCAGDVEYDLTSGEIPWLNFTFSGVYALPTDSVVETVTYDTTIPQIVKATTTTLGAYAAIIEKISLKHGNKVVERTSMNATEGVLSFMIGDREPSGVMTCEAVLMATTSANFFSYFHSGTTKALSLVLGATGGNIATITAPVCLLRAPKWNDRDGMRTFDVEFQCARSTAGNDELVITLT
jgi:hypothetical protein